MIWYGERRQNNPRFDREFTDPFTGETLDDPKRKSYRVTYSAPGSSRSTVEINTLAEGKLTHAQAKEKLAKRPALMMNSKSEITVHNVKRSD